MELVVEAMVPTVVVLLVELDYRMLANLTRILQSHLNLQKRWQIMMSCMRADKQGDFASHGIVSGAYVAPAQSHPLAPTVAPPIPIVAPPIPPVAPLVPPIAIPLIPPIVLAAPFQLNPDLGAFMA
ncbi:hypothetical protein GH714_020009 [Hevea brasiliensis]|uniref:Uncharacterized protein n=1 Tax=Hevea brasiliensis TaxID=3981 RepID=A0A6A6MZP2_HEVBR|nr:hypothetical protein GH714_020009 [Hevea brasiliensis]